MTELRDPMSKWSDRAFFLLCLWVLCVELKLPKHIVSGVISQYGIDVVLGDILSSEFPGCSHGSHMSATNVPRLLDAFARIGNEMPMVAESIDVLVKDARTAEVFSLAGGPVKRVQGWTQRRSDMKPQAVVCAVTYLLETDNQSACMRVFVQKREQAAQVVVAGATAGRVSFGGSAPPAPPAPPAGGSGSAASGGGASGAGGTGGGASGAGGSGAGGSGARGSGAGGSGAGGSGAGGSGAGGGAVAPAHCILRIPCSAPGAARRNPVGAPSSNPSTGNVGMPAESIPTLRPPPCAIPPPAAAGSVLAEELLPGDEGEDRPISEMVMDGLVAGGAGGAAGPSRKRDHTGEPHLSWREFGSYDDSLDGIEHGDAAYEDGDGGYEQAVFQHMNSWEY